MDYSAWERLELLRDDEIFFFLTQLIEMRLGFWMDFSLWNVDKTLEIKMLSGAYQKRERIRNL